MRRVGLLLVIVLVAAALRVGWALQQPANHLAYDDSKGYDAVAINFLDGNGFMQGGSTRVSRMPVYPLFLAACYKIFGRDCYAAPRVIQSLAGSLVCVLVYAIAAPVFGRGVGLLAAAIAAVYSFFVYYSGLLLTETLFTLALTLFMYLILSIDRRAFRGVLAPAAVAGVLAGTTVLLKPSFLTFVPFMGLIWLVVSRRPARALTAMVVIVLCTGFTMCPWIVRNWTLTERFVPTTLLVGISLYEGVHPGADGGPAMDRLPERIYGLSEYDENRAYLEKARKVIREEPGRIVALAGRKFLRFWNVVPNSSDHQGVIYRVVSIVSIVPLLCFAIVGVLRGAVPRGERLLLLSAPIHFTLLHMLFVSSIRYRAPVMPMMIVLAAVGVFRLLGRPMVGEVPVAVLDDEPPCEGAGA